ncbi:MAG: hypothetical protein AAFU78_05265 [Cyanobacteria bacterium J06633_2]
MTLKQSTSRDLDQHKQTGWFGALLGVVGADNAHSLNHQVDCRTSTGAS